MLGITSTNRQAGRQEEVKIQTESSGMVVRQAFQKKLDERKS
jgi:hypothetical protein